MFKKIKENLKEKIKIIKFYKTEKQRDMVERFIANLIDNNEGEIITEEFLQLKYAELLKYYKII